MLLRRAIDQSRFAHDAIVDWLEQAIAGMHDQVLGRPLHDVPLDRLLLNHGLQFGRGIGGRD